MVTDFRGCVTQRGICSIERMKNPMHPLHRSGTKISPTTSTAGLVEGLLASPTSRIPFRSFLVYSWASSTLPAKLISMTERSGSGVPVKTTLIPSAASEILPTSSSPTSTTTMAPTTASPSVAKLFLIYKIYFTRFAEQRRNYWCNDRDKEIPARFARLYANRLRSGKSFGE